MTKKDRLKEYEYLLNQLELQWNWLSMDRTGGSSFWLCNRIKGNIRNYPELLNCFPDDFKFNGFRADEIEDYLDHIKNPNCIIHTKDEKYQANELRMFIIQLAIEQCKNG
jgi:hypothetical protein